MLKNNHNKNNDLWIQFTIDNDSITIETEEYNEM